MTVYEGQFQVHFVPAVADKDAPTVAEITAGDDLTAYIPKNGWTPNVRNNRVDGSSLAETFDSETMGSNGAQLSVTFKRNDPDDTAWTTLNAQGTTGFFVVLPLNGSAAPAASDEAEVWPVETGLPVVQNTAANQQQRFVVDCAVTSAPSLTAVVAA